MIRLPDFLILGAMKAGTSSLADWMNEHPQIFLPGKEVQFFNGKNFGRGRDWYAAHFAGTAKPVVGEKTPAYLYSEECAGRIRNFLGHPRLIVVLRHPVDRMWSNYCHTVLRGQESLSFAGAVQADAERERQGNLFRCYARRSRYAFQMARYLEHFDRSRMHLLAFEDLMEKPQEELRRIYSFLGVEEGFQNQNLKQSKNRTVRIPRSPWLAVRIRQRLRSKERWEKFVAARWPFFWKAPGRMPAGLRAGLEPLFYEDVAALDAMMGTRFYDRWFPGRAP
jgi:hypothetical protein